MVQVQFEQWGVHGAGAAVVVHGGRPGSSSSKARARSVVQGLAVVCGPLMYGPGGAHECY